MTDHRQNNRYFRLWRSGKGRGKQGWVIAPKFAQSLRTFSDTPGTTRTIDIKMAGDSQIMKWTWEVVVGYLYLTSFVPKVFGHSANDLPPPGAIDIKAEGNSHEHMVSRARVPIPKFAQSLRTLILRTVQKRPTTTRTVDIYKVEKWQGTWEVG